MVTGVWLVARITDIWVNYPCVWSPVSRRGNGISGLNAGHSVGTFFFQARLGYLVVKVSSLREFYLLLETMERMTKAPGGFLQPKASFPSEKAQ